MTIATTAPHLAPGTVIDGTYTLGAVVRTRGGSATYEATDLSGGKVAVTAYAPSCFLSPVALERSLRELRQLEKVQSAHIVRVFDAGKMQSGGIYEVHERLSGTPLAELGAMPAAEVAQAIQDIVTALAAAQKVGVVHRNLGAESILRSGRDIRLFNFAVGDPQGGVSFGAIDCIAPEQVEGKNIDERTLVYNLAALTFRLLKGQSLFSAEDTGTALLQHAASLPPEQSMPGQLFSALAKDPKARPALSKFIGDLDAIVRDFPREADHSSRDSLDDLMDPEAPPQERANSPAAPVAAPVAPAPMAAKPVAPAPAKPAIAPPPAVGPKIAPPPSLGLKPAAPGAVPPAVAAPSFGPPSVAPPTFGAPTLSAPLLGAPSVTAPSATAGAPAAKPRTRGWTMFMEATDGESGGAGTPGVPVTAPLPVAAPAPVFAPAPTPAPAPVPVQAAPPAQPGEVKPSTRGWTMIMDEPAEADPAALAVTSPAAAASPAPASPTTRGWTMLEDLSDSVPAPAAPTPSAPDKPEPAAAASGNAPSSRGWTMFMEAELQNKDEPAEPAEPDPNPAFYDGPVATEAGTMISFAPSQESPNARPRGTAGAASSGAAEAEPLTAFGARFRGAEPEAPAKASAGETSAPQADLPSFAGNSSFDFGGLTPPAQQPSEAKKQAPPPESVFAEAEAADTGGGGSKVLVIVIIILVIAAVAVLALTST